MISVTHCFTSTTVRAFITGFAADGPALPEPERLFSRPLRKDQEFLGPPGLAANSTEESVEATISALTDLQHDLTLQDGEGGVSSKGRVTEVAIRGADTGNKPGVDDRQRKEKRSKKVKRDFDWRAEILFPKFQPMKSYTLESLLRNFGVSSIFSDATDFSGISQKMMLKLVKHIHSAFFLSLLSHSSCFCFITLLMRLRWRWKRPSNRMKGRPDIKMDFS
ncbi:hypothetical protein L3Q82_011277, partial [Scortum barcoo]